MPNANFVFTDKVTFLGRDIPLLKPIALFNARRLESLLPQIAALNAARKTKREAAAVLGLNEQTLATYIKLTQTTWLGKIPQPASAYRNPTRHQIHVKAWKKRNPEKVAAIKRRYYLRRKAARLAQSTHA
jgi:hypothetical protein